MGTIIDLTDYTMHPADGLQFYNKQEAQDYIKRNKLKGWVVIKDEKPYYMGSSWKQTYTIRPK